MIKERVDDDYMSRLTNVLTSIKGVNKTDVVTLASSCGVRRPLLPLAVSLHRGRLIRSPDVQSFADIASTDSAALLALPGVGEKKAKRVRDAMTGSFIVGGSKKKKKGLAEAISAMGGQQLN